jgi:hypothetical protein
MNPLEPMTGLTTRQHIKEFGGFCDPEILRAFLDEVPL